MGTVDHVVNGCGIRGCINLFNGVLERLARREGPISLNRERDHRRHLLGLGGERNANGFFRVGNRKGRDHIFLGFSERRNLRTVISLSLLHRHASFCAVAIATRTHAATDDHMRNISLVFATDVLQQINAFPIKIGELLSRIPEFVSPFLTRTPGRAFENEPYMVILGNVYVVTVVPSQRFAPVLILEQHQCSKLGKIEPVVKDQSGFESPVGQEQVAG